MLDLDDIAEVVASAVREATAPLITRIDDLERRELVLPEKGEAGPQGEPGEKGEPGEVPAKILESMIASAVAAIPAPEPGERGAEGQKGEAGADGRDGSEGAAGIGLADALIDSNGALVLTMTDGRTKTLSQVVGSDGENGKDGAPGETFALDDFTIDLAEDGRTLSLKFEHGAVAKSFDLTIPALIDQGVFKQGHAYVKGDAVTWGGSLWIAQAPTDAKPDGPDSGWRLAVKKGRDGRDAAK